MKAWLQGFVELLGKNLEGLSEKGDEIEFRRILYVIVLLTCDPKYVGWLGNVVKDVMDMQQIDHDRRERLAQAAPTRVEDLGLSVRTYNCLKREKLDTVGQLVEKSAEELLQFRNFGPRPLAEIREKLAGLGLRLKGD